MNRTLASILIGCLAPGSLYGFSRVRTAAGEPLRLPSSRVQLVVSEGIRSAQNILPGGDPLAALDAARQEWNQLSTSSVFFQPFTSRPETLARNDGINLITFSDPALFPGDTDTLATTVIFFSRSTGIVTDTDVIFNPAVKFFVTPGSEGLDLQSVATHEFGHAITADHTAVLSATMFQSSGELEFFQRSLDHDDVAFAASAFPSASRPFGSISGRVLAGGASVFGAHVVAYDPARNIFISGVSLLDGQYVIDSVPPGSYQVYAEPFDGPVTVESLLSGNRQSFFGAASTTFVTSAGAAVAVSEGQNIRQADILVSPGNATVNITRAGRNFVRPSNSATRFLVGPGPVLAGPGESFTFVVVGDGITPESVVSPAVRLELEGSGLRVRNRGGSTFQSGTAFLFAEITVEEGAAPGPRQVKVTGGGQVSYYTAGLLVAERNATQSAHRLAGVDQDAERFTGIAVTNLSGSSTVVRALYYDSSGELFSIPGMENPAFFSVPAGGQVARLTSEIFGAVRRERGWVELQADQADVYSFFLSGDGPGTQLTGSDVPPSGLTRGIFTDVRQNAVFQTEIHLANANGTAATVVFRFVGISGAKLGPVTRIVGPRASLSETAEALFGGLATDGGYVTFASDLPVQALEVLHSASALVSLNAQDLSAAPATIVAPHFAVGSAGGLSYFSTLYLVNPGDSLAQAVIEARDRTGRLLGSPVVSLGPEQVVRLGVAETFGLGPAGFPILGSLAIRSLAGGSLFGSVFLGDAGAGSFASEYPLEPAAGLGKDLLFEHLATMAGFFTGIAIYNASPTTPASIRVEVRTPAGDRLGGAFQKVLLPNEKLTSQITELVSASINRAGGYIRVRSDQPVAAIVLFGDAAGTVLAAVPASKVR